MEWSMANPRNEYVKHRWQRLIEEFGGKCDMCEKTWDLEFAHVEPTNCVGKGRSKRKRLTDILQHRDAYKLLCETCHDLRDGRPLRKRQSDYLRAVQ